MAQSKVQSQTSSGSRGLIIALLVIFFILLIVYIIVLFFAYRDKFGPFKTYTPVPAPSNAFYPLGNIRPATEEELAQRNALAQQLGVS